MVTIMISRLMDLGVMVSCLVGFSVSNKMKRELTIPRGCVDNMNPSL